MSNSSIRLKLFHFHQGIAGIGKVRNEEGIMRERTSNLGDLKYVQIHDLDDSFNNSGVHCTYDLRLQIKQRGSFVSGFK